MIIVDANLLIYSVDRQADQHKPAKAWLERAMSGQETVALPWIVLLAFLRVSTRSGLFQNPLSLKTALDLVDSWLEHESVVVIHSGPQHYRILRRLLLERGTGGNLTSDAHLAALAIEHGAVLYSFDRGFSRFPGVEWKEPL